MHEDLLPQPQGTALYFICLFSIYLYYGLDNTSTVVWILMAFIYGIVNIYITYDYTSGNVYGVYVQSYCTLHQYAQDPQGV